MAESVFHDVNVCGLFALACSHLTLTRTSTVNFEGFVRRKGRVYVATNKVWEQHLLSNSSLHFRPLAQSDTLWKKYRCSRYYSDGFAIC